MSLENDSPSRGRKHGDETMGDAGCGPDAFRK